MRKYIRHPNEIPIEYKISGEISEKKEYMKNISFGGLCFRTNKSIEPETILILRVPSINPDFEATGKVVWCLEYKDYVEVGIEFIEKNDAFRIRLIEQICYIKKYKREIFKKEGRELTDEEAAIEWTSKFAGDFP